MYDQVTLGLNVDPFILSALKEDITSEDVSTNSVMPNPTPGVVDLICKEDGIICGLQVFERVFTLLDSSTRTEFYVKDGDHVENKQLVGKIYGDIRVLLCGERTALNYLQRMSGIATYTSQVAALLEGTGIKLLDTRKTTPNNRIFEKYSVRVGGGNNHRYNLSDGVLLKDNHIGAAGGVKQAISMAKAYAPFVRKIEIEVENLDMVKEAVEAGADIIMLDNMTTEQLKESIDYIAGRAEIEVSGNVTKENVSRQIIVQDISLLRANGATIFSTNKGYLLQEDRKYSRVFKVYHTDDQVEEELSTIVDAGGQICDVFVYHKVYGVLKADMGIKSRRDIRAYMEEISTGKSSLLKNVTSGYHYHTIDAESEEILDAIQEELQQKGFLAKLQDYEPVDFWGGQE